MTELVSPRDLLALAGDHLWQSTLFAAAAAAVAVLVRRQSPSLRYWIWLIASAKFVIPFAALVAIGGYGSWRTVDVVPYRERPILIEAVGQPFSQDAVTIRPVRSRAAADRAIVSWLPTMLLSLWAAGSALFLLRSLLHWNRIRRIARSATWLADGREVDILRTLTGSETTPLPLMVTASSLEPGIFGIVRPVLLWPRAITERLTDEQIAAVLAHELCHLRRRDNLAALFHLGVQTIFWFHPLVWWIGARLITERERACDAEVIQRGNERETYAESILKTCQFFVESPLACVSGVTGSDLKKRIEEIMTHESSAPRGLWPKALLTAVAVIAFVSPVAVGALNPPPQTRDLPAPSTLPAFEEVSIRENTSAGRGGRGGQFQPTRFSAQNLTLKAIVKVAFARQGAMGPNSALQLMDAQVIGAPEWMDSVKFDVVAITPAPTQPTPAAQTRLMIQRALVERFKMKAHWETRELPVYLLTKARADGALGAGLVLKSDADCEAVRRDGPPPLPEPGVPAPPPPCGAIQFGPGQLLATGSPVEFLAQTLMTVPAVTGIDRLVIDRTGLKGTYGFTLKFAAAGSSSPDPNRPELFTAVQEQLGLKLEPARAPVDVLVIESVERPTSN